MWNCPQVNTKRPHWWLINICSCNGLVQATSHYLNQCWPSYMTTYSATMSFSKSLMKSLDPLGQYWTLYTRCSGSPNHVYITEISSLMEIFMHCPVSLLLVDQWNTMLVPLSLYAGSLMFCWTFCWTASSSAFYEAFRFLTWQCHWEPQLM